MTLRSRPAIAPPAVVPGSALAVPVGKGYGAGIPPEIEAAEARSQMGPTSPFSPGEPIGPYDGFSRTPRSHDYAASVNTTTRPRAHERVSFETLKGLIGSYDVAQICLRHRIASLRSLDYKLVSADGYEGDIAADVAEGKRVLKRPDRKTLFKPWLAKYLRGILSYDAGTLYKMRNRAGRPVGLKVIDGTMIAPLQDYWGDRPDAPAPAYVQYVQGLPWNWLTAEDLVYEPYDPQDDSPYGRAPLEDILLSANTDLRFQLYFLQRFTEGNLPAAFADAPESWTPEQIEQFQEYWDGFMAGDQSRKHQIRWLPPGSKIAWSNEKDFDDHFSLFLMRKCCASFSVVPSDLGFTESVNRSSGESQADVQHRVGDLPMAHHIQDILTAFLQDDLQLPLKFVFDLGEEQDDRVDQATADDKYMKMGVVGPSEIREMRYGFTDPVPIPRFIYTERAGPIPISSLLAVAGQIDPATELPEPGSELPHTVFGGTEGVLPNPPIKVMSLAEQEYGPSAMPPAPPPQPKMTDADETQPGQPVAKEGGSAALRPCAHEGAEPVDLITGERVAWVCPECDTGLPADWQLPAGRPVAKEGEGAAPAGNVTAGITAETGIYGNPLIGADEDEDGLLHLTPAAHEAAKVKRLAVAKAAGEVAVAGLAILAQDTGRVLMIQRALDPGDPAGGTWEFPGGHIDPGESPLEAAWREFGEETGCAPPAGSQSGTWTSPDGIYQGFVWTAGREASVAVRGVSLLPNPDDPDGDAAEAIAWWDPADLPGLSSLRPELAANLPEVLPLLGCGPEEVAAVKAVAGRPKHPGPSAGPAGSPKRTPALALPAGQAGSST